jgi:putative phage-type endonuclease
VTPPVLIPCEVGSPQWFDHRAQGVTASEIPVILGLAPWGSPFDLYYRKLGMLEPDRDNDAMAWGRDLEDVILRRFAREHPEFHTTPGGLYHHGGDHRWMATPDGLAFETVNVTAWDGPPEFVGGETVAVVQVKTAGSQEHWGEPGTDVIPPYYLAQVRWEMHVMDVRTAFVPVLFAGRTYREYVVEQNDEDVALMVAEADTFLKHVQAEEPPDIDWRPATTQALKQLHPDVDDTTVTVPGIWQRQWRIADRLQKAAGERKALAENRMRGRMGRARTAVDEQGRKVATRAVFPMRERTMPATTVNRITITRKELTS